MLFTYGDAGGDGRVSDGIRICDGLDFHNMFSMKASGRP